MGFTLQGFGPFLHWLTLGILFVLPVLVAFVLYKLGGLPGAIARARGHPHAEAISVCGWMGVLTLILWPIALIWAYLPVGSPPFGLPQKESEAVIAELEAASERLRTLEDRLSAR